MDTKEALVEIHKTLLELAIDCNKLGVESTPFSRGMGEAYTLASNMVKRIRGKVEGDDKRAEPHCDKCGNDFPEDQLDPHFDGQRTLYLCVDCLEQALWGTSDQGAQDNKTQEILDARKDRNPHIH